MASRLVLLVGSNPLPNYLSACALRPDQRKQPRQSRRQIDCVRLDGLTIGLGGRNLGVERLNVRMIEKSAAKRLIGGVAVIQGGSPLPSFPSVDRRINVGIVRRQ